MTSPYDRGIVSRKTGYVLALIVVLAVLPYVSALGMGFIYDDRPQIENNPHLRLWPGYARVFTSDVWSLTDVGSDARYYRPLMWVAYNAIYSMAGPAPWAFHLLNLLLHAAVTAVVFLLTFELWKDLRVSTIAGNLLAPHPLHIEPVIWFAALPELGYKCVEGGWTPTDSAADYVYMASPPADLGGTAPTYRLDPRDRCLCGVPRNGSPVEGNRDHVPSVRGALRCNGSTAVSLPALCSTRYGHSGLLGRAHICVQRCDAIVSARRVVALDATAHGCLPPGYLHRKASRPGQPDLLLRFACEIERGCTDPRCRCPARRRRK